MDHDEPAGIESFLGSSAGAICYTPLDESNGRALALSEAAEIMWESLRSAWVLVEMWNDGATVWRSPDRYQTAIVTPEGDLQVHAHR